MKLLIMSICFASFFCFHKKYINSLSYRLLNQKTFKVITVIVLWLSSVLHVFNYKKRSLRKSTKLISDILCCCYCCYKLWEIYWRFLIKLLESALSVSALWVLASSVERNIAASLNDYLERVRRRSWVRWHIFLLLKATAVLQPTHASDHSPPKALQKRDSVFVWWERAIVHQLVV
jgi:hypothetical protein